MFVFAKGGSSSGNTVVSLFLPMTLSIKLANELQVAEEPVDAIVLALAAEPIPQGFWGVRASRIVLASGLEKRWHFFRQVMAHCELALIESGDFELLKGVGLAGLWPIDRPCWISASDSDLSSARDIDVLCIWDQ